MASGVYGIIKPADFVPKDHAEVWLSYRQNRADKGTGFNKVDTSKYLTSEPDPSDINNQISGLYQLKLPLDTFNKVGVYNIYIRPKQTNATIVDIGVLSAYPDIRGIILSTNDIGAIDDDGLVGYRIEYYDQTGNKKPNFFRIVTSNNKCEPTNQNTNGTNSYRFNNNSNLEFLTLSPSSSNNVKPSSLPYIGSPQDKVVISNTFFNPEMIEIEMTENDLESLYLSINGNQIRTLDNGLITTYDNNNNIVNQAEHYIIKESETGKPAYEVKQNKTNIDFNQNYSDITSIV